PVKQWWSALVTPAHLVDHPRSGLLGRELGTEFTHEVLGPLGRAHALQCAGGAFGPGAAVFGDDAAAHLVPQLLGVDEYSVHVEHDSSHTQTVPVTDVTSRS